MKIRFLAFSCIFLLTILGIPVWVLRNFSPGSAETPGNGPLIRLLDKATGQVKSIPLEEYLVGVVAAEMPANFELEALKAQAVAARTYASRRMYSFGATPAEGHGSAEICSDPTHCQAWINEGEMREKWGRLKYYFYLDKIRKAVKMTEGIVITYNGSLIEPVYHGACGGEGTENSEDVWSNRIPYLRGVDCSIEYRAAGNVYVREFAKSELKTLMNKAGAVSVPALAGAGPPIKPVSTSARGRLKEVSISGYLLTGAQLRGILGLTSTLITWEDRGDKIMFTSRGKGHAVGMCQYGANGMAMAGKDYKEIIRYYYTGVNVQKARY